MQYVNDDMDELFKKAAENYPLDTKTADWNKVLAALQTEAGGKPDRKGSINRRYFWLLLLLPLGFVCSRFYSPLKMSEGSFKTTRADHHSSGEKITQQQEAHDYEVSGNTIEHEASNNVNFGDVQQKNEEEPNKTGAPSGFSFKPENSSYLPQANRKVNTLNPVSYNKTISVDKEKENQIAEVDFNDYQPFSDRSRVSEIAFSIKPLHGFSTSLKSTPDPLLHSSIVKESQSIRVARRKKFYVGLMGGIDATTVKFQKIENTGFSYGFLFGYQLNKQWSIETGAYLEKKYYYSDGKYFNTSKLYMPQNTWIDDAYGNCNMIEVPLAAKYNFNTHGKPGFFAVVGASSYIMRKEDYTYNYYYGTVGPVPHKKEYRNSSTTLFSALSISAGYTHHLGNLAEVRVEPYLKLPVSGMGIGKLPFLSGGIQLGLTKKF